MPERYVYFVQQTVRDEDGNLIVCCAIEGQKGYRLMGGQGEFAAPWTWGKDYEEAMKVAEKSNAEMGIDTEQMHRIICSTM